MNEALLAKWEWRYMNERNALWRDIMARKYVATGRESPCPKAYNKVKGLGLDIQMLSSS